MRHWLFAYDVEYTTYRNNVIDYCTTNSIVSKTKVGEAKWNKCLKDVPALDGFKSSIRARLSAGSDFHGKALQALVVDTLKKISGTMKKLTLKRALKRRGVDADEEAEEADIP